MALSDTANLLVKLNLGGNFLSQIGKSTKGLTNFERASNRAYRAGAQIGTGIKNVARIAATATAAIGSIAIASAKVAADFESQLNTINTVARASPEALGKIGASIRKIARDTGTTTDDLTQGYYDLVSAGIKAADATNVLEAANRLAIGGLSTTAESVDLLTTAINTYGGDATKAAGYADVFAKAIERGKVTAAELASSFAQVGPIAAASGVSIAELGAAYARLTSAGVPAAEAATQVRSAIVALTKRTTPLEKLEKATKKSYLAIAGSKGLVVALQEMRKDAEKSGTPLIDLLGRVEGLNFTLATTGPNFEKYNADLAAMADASGTAADQMSERQKGLNYQLKLISARVKDAGITLGTALLPGLTKAAGAIANALNDPAINKALTDFGTEVGNLFSDENVRNGINAIKELVPVLVDGARVTASVVGTAVKLFRSLPPELQGLAVAGLAINKLTGGLVTNIAGGLISSVLKQLVSGVVNVNGAVVNVNGAGGIPGAGNPLGGGPGGPAITLGSLILPVTAAVAATVLSTQDLIARKTLEDRRREGGLRARQYQGSAAGTMNKPIPVIPIGPGLIGNFGRGAPDPRGVMAGVLQRALAKGLKPTADQIQRTFENNVARREEAAFAANAGRRDEIQAIKEVVFAVQALQLPPPVVNVTSVSVQKTLTVQGRYSPHQPSRRSGPGGRIG